MPSFADSIEGNRRTFYQRIAAGKLGRRGARTGCVGVSTRVHIASLS
jgi:hypothetical protein